jgi:hypothetical protein
MSNLPPVDSASDQTPSQPVETNILAALGRARSAVELDVQGDFRSAIAAYSECIELLGSVLEGFPSDGCAEQVEKARRVTMIVSIVWLYRNDIEERGIA